jgi:hypothetical protein
MVVNTKAFTISIIVTVVSKLSQLTPTSVKFCFTINASSNAVVVTPRSITNMIQRGTIFILFSINFLLVVSIIVRAINE